MRARAARSGGANWGKTLPLTKMLSPRALRGSTPRRHRECMLDGEYGYLGVGADYTNRDQAGELLRTNLCEKLKTGAETNERNRRAHEASGADGVSGGAHLFAADAQLYFAGVRRNYAYAALPVLPGQLGDAVRGLKALNFAGVNVTAPYKVEVMQYLDEIAPDAKMYGSVNTVKYENGKLYGYNTDADGFYLSLVNGGAPIIGKDLLILGAAARRAQSVSSLPCSVQRALQS